MYVFLGGYGITHDGTVGFYGLDGMGACLNDLDLFVFFVGVIFLKDLGCHGVFSSP